MKTIILASIFCIGSIAPLLADGTNVFADEKSKDSYALGMMITHAWEQQGVDVDVDSFIRGLKDGMSGATLMTAPEAESTLKEFQKTVVARRQQILAELGTKNKAEGVAFLLTNKNNPGVVVLPDGLQYKIITEGDGPIPSTNDIMTVNYRGTFIDGTEFESTGNAGHPIQVQANRVIPGWTEALAKMKIGSKWQLFVPSELAYGAPGFRGIPPDKTLIFEVELLSAQTVDLQSAPSSPAPRVSSDIIKVPSEAEMQKGAQVEIIKQEDIQKLQSQSNTN